MKNKHKVVLVDGEYSLSDSKELLFGLINYKRNFHTLKNFSSEVRTGKQDAFAVQRRTELAHAIIDVQELYDKAMEEGLEFKIDCNIEIQLLKPHLTPTETSEAEA